MLARAASIALTESVNAEVHLYVIELVNGKAHMPDPRLGPRPRRLAYDSILGIVHQACYCLLHVREYKERFCESRIVGRVRIRVFWEACELGSEVPPFQGPIKYRVNPRFIVKHSLL